MPFLIETAKIRKGERERADDMQQMTTGFCMVSPYINTDSSIIYSVAYRYFGTDQLGTSTNLALVFITHPYGLCDHVS